MKHIATTFLALSFCTLIIAQAPLVKQWDKRFGGTGDDRFRAMQQTFDGGYILGGESSSRISGDKTQANWDTLNYWTDYWVVKIDSLGNKQWDKRFGGDNGDDLTCLQQTLDGGYILGGYSLSGISGDRTQANWNTLIGLTNGDYWVVKIDSLGNKQWDKRFGGGAVDFLQSLQQTTDGGYILGGWSSSGISGDKTEPLRGTFGYDYWVVKIDSLGNKQWDKTFGGTDVDRLWSLKQTIDGGYILGGSSASGIGADKTQANWDTTLQSRDYWIIKIDSLGNKVWDNRYGGTKWDDFSYLQQTSEGGYILAGSSVSDSSGDKTQPNRGTGGDYWIVKINSFGIKQWDKRFGGTGNEDSPSSFTQTDDGGYLVSGTSDSNMGGDKSENNLGHWQTWLIKIDSVGNKQWDKTIFTSPPNGDYGGVAAPTKRGCYAVANGTLAGIGGYKTQPNWDTVSVSPWFTFDYWIIKFCDSAQAVHCQLASPNIYASQSQFCASDSALICAATIYTNYIWNNGGLNQCITTSQAGNYYVTVTDANGCTAESNHLAVSVLPHPLVSISVTGDTLSVYGAVTRQWYLNGSAINGATSNVYIASQGGSYTVMVTDTNGCAATSSAVIISGIENVGEEDVVSVYQLTSGLWQLTVGNNYIGATEEIFDANGRLVFKSEIRSPKSEINFSAAQSVYLLRISSSKSSVVRKLVKL
jgi:hypothetical protein